MATQTEAPCPRWCTDHDGDEHFGQPVQLDVASCSVELVLQQRDGSTAVSLAADDGRAFLAAELTPGETRNLAQALVALADGAEQ
jgi:hypothetical protein